MEACGLPHACAHIVTVMVYLNVEEFPLRLMLKRWTKGAKDLVTINKKNRQSGEGTGSTQDVNDTLRDPILERTKGSGAASSSQTILRGKRRHKCLVCHVVGHNKSTCLKNTTRTVFEVDEFNFQTEGLEDEYA
ncbi:hypothetical protein SESBI_44324, partial [Sesbania bispinosa]